MHGMKGVFGLLVLLLLGAAVITITAAQRRKDELLTDGVSGSIEMRRAYYAATDVEDSFWQTIRASARAWSKSCIQCDAASLRQRLSADTLSWKEFVEGGQFSVSLALGKTGTDGWPAEERPFSLEPLKVQVSDIDSDGAAQLVDVRIQKTPDSDGIFARISGRSKTVAIIGAGEGFSCIRLGGTGASEALPPEIPLC